MTSNGSSSITQQEEEEALSAAIDVAQKVKSGWAEG